MKKKLLEIWKPSNEPNLGKLVTESDSRFTNQLKNVLIITLLFLNCLILTVIPMANSENVCNSIEVGPVDVAPLRKLRECDVVAGHVKIAKIDVANFPDIVSSVREITGYLLIYRVRSLKSLGDIFPNLTVIRGRSLLFDEYSMAIYENEHLMHLELAALMRIQQGSIRIDKNPSLCYLSTVNWPYLLENTTKQHLYFKDNKHQYHCPLCSKQLPQNDHDLHFNGSCWSYKVFQRHCPDKCGSNGCNLSGNCCPPTCLFGCTADDVNDCQICEKLRLKNSNGHISCVDHCKLQYYKLQNRECIPKEDCNRRGFALLDDLCVDKCPRNHHRTNLNGTEECVQLCRGHFVINTAEDILQLSGCIKIEGSITIALRTEKDQDGNIILDLEKSLGTIEEITGNLKIIKSPQLMSLHFFRSLNTIVGDELIDHKYALYVVDNYHLEKIWSHNVAILKGRIFFHLNPMLCIEKILKIGENMKSSGNITIQEASPNSNGERTICGDAVKSLNATVEDFNSHQVRIKVNPMKMDERRALLGYLYYYKESAIGTPTMYDGRHGCGIDRWKFEMTHSQNVRHIISNLKPFTRYAFFVKTFTMTDYHIQTDAYSPIEIFTTLPSKPGRVERIFIYTPYIKQIDLHWWPPRNPNGIITKYLITVTKVEAKANNTSALVGPNLDFPAIFEKKLLTNCTCSIDTKFRGAAPVDANHYDEEEIIFDDRLPELLFPVRKSIIESPKVAKNVTVTSTTIKPANISENVTVTNSTQKPVAFLNKTDIIQFYTESLELNSTLEQDTGTSMFNITKPKEICSIPNPDERYQSVNDCVIEKNYTGIEVSGDVHKYEIKDLDTNQNYKISIRACVENIEDPCSEEITIEAATDSEDLEQFFREQ